MAKFGEGLLKVDRSSWAIATGGKLSDETKRQIDALPKFDYSTLPVVKKTDEQIMADMELTWLMRSMGM